MVENAAQLDAEELLHFAIKASQSNENEKAILYLKHALTQEPDNARLHYFLGALHAEIGMYDRAVEEMTKAIEIDPSMETAQFQLGLLYATSARVAEAEEAWKALDDLGNEHPLFLFKTGLLHLTRDEFEEAKANLKRGIELNNFNLDINRDMQRILDDILKAAPDSPVEAPTADEDTPSEKATSGNHIFLSAYNKDDDDDKKH